MRRLLRVALVCLTLLAVSGASRVPEQGRAETTACTPLMLGASYIASVDVALRSKLDIWGRTVLSRPEGPTYRNVEPYLKPLMLVGKPAGRSGTALTDSGVYYVPMGEPGGRSFADGGPTEPFALHVADGSQIVSRRANGRRVTLHVGSRGSERFGSCLSRLAEPRLASGYLPVLTVSYTDARGVRYTHESFVALDPVSGVLASFVRIEADRGASAVRSTQVQVHVSDPDATTSGRELRSGGRTVLAYGPGGELGHDGALRYRLDLAGRTPAVVYLVRPIDPTTARLVADAETYAAARVASVRAWDQRLAEGARIEVPEQRVMNAMRNLLIQNLQLAWRYSVGNAYEAFYQPEGSAAVLRLAEYGFLRDAREGLSTLLPKSQGRSTNWEQGEKLAAAAAYYLLSGDGAFIRRNTPVYATYARDFADRRSADPHGLLDPQRYSGDIGEEVYGLHHQARAWRGLRDIAYVWGLTGRAGLAKRYASEAKSFSAALRRAISGSTVHVSPREAFVPVSLLRDPPRVPWDPVTTTREGSYWNLVAPYGWASGVIPRTSALARRVLEYALNRGSFLLGLVRFDYYPTGAGNVRCDGLPGLRTPGLDNVYGVHRVQFLAALDRPDLLVLALYGKLAHGMTRGTFIAGEGETIGPVPPGACGRGRSEYYRSTYLPPSSANNDLFLVTLREQLAHWNVRDDGRPEGLQLAFSTPRGWLADGRRIAVDDLPTPFGRLGYSLDSHLADGYVDVEVHVPKGRRIGKLELRVRLPESRKPRIGRIGGTSIQPRGETFELTGRRGTVRMRVLVR